MDERAFEVLAAKQAIREVLTNYCRSIDRLDRELMESVWHPGATVDYEGSFRGSAADLVDFFMRVHLEWESHSHQVTNTSIVVDGDHAASEAYVTARLRSRPDANGRRIDLLVSGRYLDRWSQRGGVWAIDERRQVTDVFAEYEVRPDLGGAVPDRPDTTVGWSRRDRDDPSYELLPGPTRRT